MKKRLWLKLFINVAVIFAIFVIVIALANSTLLSRYFLIKEEKLLLEKSKELSSVDFGNEDAVLEKINLLADDYNFDIEIYEKNGKILYTTARTQMMDFIQSGLPRPDFSMNRAPYEVTESHTSDDGAVIEKAVSRPEKTEYLICKRESGGVVSELRIQTDILNNSAYIAGEFITIIAAVCLLLSLVWIFFFSKRFTKPIAKMSAVTEKMSELNFSESVPVSGEDEIAQLGNSINDMSLKLYSALDQLNRANEKLTNEIELERRLDVMRRAFVANVSHELKTPLSIISGYAEGLKLNVNNESRDSYCDTIIDETERMNRLVMSILELSKYESGQVEQKYEVFDIGSLSASLAERILSTRKDITLVNEIPESTLVFSDLLQTEQILKAYLENALSHTKEKGAVTLFCRDMKDGKMKIYIENEGEQIDPEIMPNIWQSFWRADKAHSRDEGRFGLGLSIVSAIVKNMGCTYGVYNTEKGVCFWFTVPKPTDNKN